MVQTSSVLPPLEWVTVKTTLPKAYPLMSTREPIRSERLILRPYAATDLDGFHLLRIQPEVMKWTSQGKPDTDLEHTRKVLENRLPGAEGESAYEFAICWAETGEMIGTGGSHMRVGELGWPVIGYMIRSEFWGKGIATELMSTFLKAYWALPREEVEVKVEKSTVVGSENEPQPEHITAITLDSNGPSQNVLGKLGFKLARKFEEEDPNNPGVNELLYGYALQKPQA
ncbi:acyl- n-acyltransferase [Trichoderma arundinaceum]|uniref:Acyl-n-acyltransferase n=1 Tax=Trichoderma arundinaceum TaxID=490622 RepID=A0A395NGI3_TRIAR|nr:acyl- n-acyltransferase [Trichoderma arundinaceum]